MAELEHQNENDKQGRGPVPEGAPSILPLEQAEQAGGKARGLARLMGLGLRVPAGFVITGARPGLLPEELSEAYHALGGGAVAVRSSAAAEDGAHASFAGQFESVLDVEGDSALRQAVERCLRSLTASRAQAYARERGEPGPMNVVVQRMVRPRVAGVLFTADPVRGGARVVVDAVPGLGEALVSGRESSDHYELSRQGALLAEELRDGARLLDPAELGLLVEQALRAEAALGEPLDLEWAIDGEGELYWLQARPITTSPDRVGIEPTEADLHEFDTPALPDHVYTRANVGEMLPGPASPLTLSTSVFGVEQGLQRMHVVCGAQPHQVRGLRLISVFSGHLFFDLTALSEFSVKVGGSTPEQLTFAICGRPVPELRVGPPAPLSARTRNGASFLHYVLSGKAKVDHFEGRLPGFHLAARGSAAELYAELDVKLPFLIEAYGMHLQSSASSGLSHGVLQGVLAKGGPPTLEHEALMASWLGGAGGLASAALVGELDEVRRRLQGQPGFERAFLRAAPSEGLAWLRSPGSGQAGTAFASFLARQGHRGLNELSMQQPSWGDDPLPLVQALRAALLGGSREQGLRREEDRVAGPDLRLRGLVGWARRGVRQRERSKALLVRVSDQFRRAYRRLGEVLAVEGKLAEAELVQFLTHRELARLIIARDPGLAGRAALRREVQRRQRRLEFPDLFVGAPRPLTDEPLPAEGEELQGRPVGRGRVRGRARVALTLDEAAELQPGEILVAPITDVGWSPYFKLIAGLATDVGSAISHGAVVARECGLPAVVNLRVASKVIRTGDMVVLDGDRGTLTRVSD